MMTGRQRVLRTLEFDRPDRAPRDLWLIPRARIIHGDALIDGFIKRWPSDFTQCSAGKPPSRRAKGNLTDPGLSTDEWGCIFENVLPGVMGEVKQPILDDYNKLDQIQAPTEFLDLDFEKINAFCRSSDKFIFASGWARPFERIQFIRGTENVLMDLAEESDGLAQLIRLVHDFFLKQYELWATTEVDALAMLDDWGSQRSLLISPAQWRRLFKPLYAQYVSVAHAKGKQFFMHSDGYIQDIIPDLVEIGVDALNSQLFCMDIEEIGKMGAGRMTFWGESDRQNILPYASVDEARDAVRRVHRNLWRNGGCVAQFEFTPDTKPANAEAVYQTWDELTSQPRA